MLSAGIDWSDRGAEAAAEGMVSATQLARLNMPFVFATGYGESGVPEAFRGRPVLQKPFGMADVEARLREAAGR